jgi:hypothetical protein
VAVTSNGSSYALYVNGAEVTKTFGGGSDTGDWFADTSDRDNICIGVLKYNSTHDNWLDGLATEVVVYDTPLSAGQISTLATTDANGGPLPPLTLPAASNVVGHWRYDNDVTWTDLSSGGNDLTVQGSPSSLLFKQGINGSKNVNTGRDNQGFPLKYQNNGAIGFGGNGAADYIALPTSVYALLEGPEAITVGAWIKRSLDSGHYDGIVSTHVNTAEGFCLLLSATYKTLFWQYDGTGSQINPAGGIELELGKWYYVVGTYDGTALRTYVNGILDQTSAATGKSLAGTDLPIFIGAQRSGAGALGASFNGQIANTQLYNRALTYAEIQQNYNSFKNRFGK